VTAFDALQDFFSLLAAIGHDFRELFEEGLGHAMDSISC
jgi:hypothetical protein